jgi:prevent-host-death family protein
VTDAARSVSNVLNRVAAGEEIEITRAGIPVAVIPPPKARRLSAGRFRELLASAPAVDDGFADDLRSIPGRPRRHRSPDRMGARAVT